VLIQSYVYGQSVNFQNLTFKLGKDWKEEKKEEKSTTFSYQKASANIKIYYLGKVSSEEAATSMVQILQSQKVNPKDVETAKKIETKVAKEKALFFEWQEELFLDTQNKTLITYYRLYLVEKKSEKYYFLAKQFYLKETQKPLSKEFDSFIEGIK
jgi:hypothetical protein